MFIVPENTGSVNIMKYKLSLSISSYTWNYLRHFLSRKMWRGDGVNSLDLSDNKTNCQ